MQLHIGIDDTDSTKGGCTTYIAARLVEKFTKMNVPFIDYPNIIRLNPNIPYKTRGNAAVALRVDIAREFYERIRETVLEQIEENSHFGRTRTEPAVAFLKRPPSVRVRKFSERALRDVLSENEAMRLVRKCGNEAATYCGHQGLVGAVAAIGHVLNSDHTFELVAYRVKENCGKRRLVDENSVIRMDRSTRPMTFNNYDYENKRALVTPHGPDPVLLGIRGENPRTVLRAYHMLNIQEPIERWVIFRTNHGTDAHFEHSSKNIRPYTPVIFKGIVRGNPRRTPGGHVFFSLNSRRKTLQCAAYEPTGSFRENIAKLIHGDEVTCFGSIREPRIGTTLTINLEKIHVNRLTDDIHVENPVCPRCSKHMKSAGKGQGFRCRRCGIAAPTTGKQMSRKQRTLRIGVYIPTSRAHRHLTKPLSRYGREKRKWDGQPPSGDWHNP